MPATLDTEASDLAAQKQITTLKASRDKLLFELDRLSVELEFYQSNNEVLKEQSKEHQLLASYWKQQSLESHRQVNQLKDMLDESSEACFVQKLPEGEILAAVSKQVKKQQELEELTQKLINSEHQNKTLRQSWLPALRQLEARLMELNSAATDAFD
eukprot:g7677.t1